MNRWISTIIVFCVGVLISYFLCDFYNDIEDRNRTNFSRGESETLRGTLEISLGFGNDRGHTFSSALRTFPEMGVNLTAFRDFGALPGAPAVILGAPRRPNFRSGVTVTRAVAYHYAVRVEHKDRAAFEEELSEQWNKTIKIGNYTTGETMPEKEEYWPLFLHGIDTRGVGWDITSDPDRTKSLEFLQRTGNVSYTSPTVSTSTGSPIVGFTKYIEISETPFGRQGVIGVRTSFFIAFFNAGIDDFILGGNGGRKIEFFMIHNGEKTLAYELGEAGDLIYESPIPTNELTSFILKVYDTTKFDNTEPTIIFMLIGCAVSLVLAIWEFFRSSASIKAEETSKAKSQFLSSISHEIRTPINGIVGISDVLSQVSLSKVAKNYVNIISSCSSSLLSLLNNVLDMSKIDAGKIEKVKKTFHLSNVVMRTVRDSWVVTKSKNDKITHINVVLTKNVPTESIISNDIHIFQILNNLMSNAVKFTDEGYVEVKVDAEQHKEDKVMVYMSIRDTGVGMDEAALKKLFKPFSRIHNGKKEKGGTGLGLVISMALAKNMGGNIKCESTPGVGTTFTANFIVEGKIGTTATKDELFVFNNETSIDIVDDTEENVNLKLIPEAKVLIVDDNAVNIMVLKKMVESVGGMYIDTAQDGREALNFIRLYVYDMIFMDKFMPVMDGVQCTKHIRNDLDSLNKDSPIIFLSADVEDSTISQCLTVGGNGFVSKPYRLAILVKKMMEVNKTDIFEKSDNLLVV